MTTSPCSSSSARFHEDDNEPSASSSTLMELTAAHEHLAINPRERPAARIGHNRPSRSWHLLQTIPPCSVAQYELM